MNLLEDFQYLLRIRNVIALPISPGIAMENNNLLSTTSLSNSIFKFNVLALFSGFSVTNYTDD